MHQARILIFEDEPAVAARLVAVLREIERRLAQRLGAFELKIEQAEKPDEIGGRELTDRDLDMVNCAAIVLDCKLAPGLDPLSRARDGFNGLYVLQRALSNASACRHVLISSGWVNELRATQHWKTILTADERDRIGVFDKDKEGYTGLSEYLLHLLFERTQGHFVGPALLRALLAAAREDRSVLLLGGSGTGKGLAAEAIHRMWQETKGGAAAPFMPMNCASAPAQQDSFRAELFGHTEGAYTGTRDARVGTALAAAGATLRRRAATVTNTASEDFASRLVFGGHAIRVRAVGRIVEIDLPQGRPLGTLFLDEVAELTEACQVLLNRFLRENEVVPLGFDGIICGVFEQARAPLVRTIAATSSPRWREYFTQQSGRVPDHHSHYGFPRQDFGSRIGEHVIVVPDLSADEARALLSALLAAQVPQLEWTAEAVEAVVEAVVAGRIPGRNELTILVERANTGALSAGRSGEVFERGKVTVPLLLSIVAKIGGVRPPSLPKLPPRPSPGFEPSLRRNAIEEISRHSMASYHYDNKTGVLVVAGQHVDLGVLRGAFECLYSACPSAVEEGRFSNACGRRKPSQVKYTLNRRLRPVLEVRFDRVNRAYQLVPLLSQHEG